MKKITTLLQEPAVWLLMIVAGLGFATFSVLRKPFKPLISKIPGNDVAADL